MNVLFLKKRNVLVLQQKRQKFTKPSVIQKIKRACFGEDAKGGMLSSKKPQLKEGRKIYIK